MPFDRSDPEPAAQQRMLQTISEAMELWGLEPSGEAEPVADSVRNHNFRVLTTSGPVFLRLAKASTARERAELEHRTILWAAERGLPVNLPLPSKDGRTLRSTGGTLVSVFPWIDGRTMDVDAPTGQEAAALGDTLGRLQEELAEFDDLGLGTCPIARPWDTQRAIEELSRVDDLIRYYPAPGPWRLQVQEWLRFKLALLESSEARPYDEYAGLAAQVCHGDFHERNVLFARDDNRVLAVVDWEMVGRMPPAFELVQALSWTHLVHFPVLDSFVAAYAKHRRVERTDISDAVDMWWQASLHNTWAYTQSFIKGNRRADRFFESNDRQLRLFADPEFRAGLVDRIFQVGS
jgi:Ser/Thr protein kinase RdoA (MazF antagonist)